MYKKRDINIEYIVDSVYSLPIYLLLSKEKFYFSRDFITSIFFSFFLALFKLNMESMMM